jgi:hypothetical protein
MAEERQIQLRRDAIADWISNDPTPASGELAVEIDTHRIRVGDGSTSATADAMPVHQPIRVYATTASVTLADSDDYTHIFITTGASDKTITLPTAADNANRMYVIKKVDSGAGTVTIDGDGAETIDGETTKLLTTQYSWMTIVCDATEWHVVDFHHAPHDTGWTSNSDWTNAELSVTHSFSTNLRNLAVRVFFSSDGTDANTVESAAYAESDGSGSVKRGFNVFQSSTDALYIQTMEDGVLLVADDGSRNVISSSAYYYRVLVYKQIP